MSQPIQLADVWRRSLEATVQFYSAMGKLAFDCLETLLATAKNSNSQLSQDGDSPSSVFVHRQASSISPKPVPVSMVLEAEVGRKALGVFLVENGFSRAVSASATVSAFVDDYGNEINPAVEFQPTSITLEPGEQMLVKVLAGITSDMPAGTRYRGEIAVPGLMGTRIPVVLGRTAEVKPKGSRKSRATSPGGSPERSRKRISQHNPPTRQKAKKRAAGL